MVTAVDWPVLAGRLEGVPAFFDELLSMVRSRTEEGVAAPELVARLRRAPAAEREAVLVGFLQDELQAVLRLSERPSATVGFFDLGMDSLMAVELRNRLNRALSGVCTVSGTAVFDHPDAESLARHLADALGMPNEDEGHGASPGPSYDKAAEKQRIHGLSDEEFLAEVSAELGERW